MRNIVIYIGSMILPDKTAGAQRSLSLSKSIRDIGMKVVLVGVDDSSNTKLSVIDTKGMCEGFDTFFVNKPKTLRQWIHHTISICEFIEVIKYYGEENVHSIIMMEYESVALWRMARYCKKHNIFLIADAEEWYEHSRLPFPMNIGKDIDTFLRMHFVYPYKINNMICISRFFEQKYANRVKSRVYIPGTIDINQNKWKSIPDYSPNGIFTIGYAGHPGMAFEKERLDWLVEAVVELNKEGHPCILKVAGVDKEFMSQRLGDMHNYKNSVQYLGKLSHIECLKMIASCEFSAIIREDKRVTKAGFPTKLSESFACGTPVISTDSSNIFEYINEMTGVKCEGFSKEKIKTALYKAMCIDKEMLVTMHRQLRNNTPLIYHEFTMPLESFMNNLH